MSENIYCKLLKIQKLVAETKLNKSGFNKFNNFRYYELDDILPVIMQGCFKENCVLYFTQINEAMVLKLKDCENPNDEISIRVTLPELTEVRKGMNIMQTLGSYITYSKRYLLMNLFNITEKDIIDSSKSDDFEAIPEKTKKEVIGVAPELDENVKDFFTRIQRLTKKHYKEVNVENMKKQTQDFHKNRFIDDKQEEFILNYLDNWGVPE